MDNIPGYFHRVFKSVQTVESYFEKEIRDPKKIVLLQSHFKDILIVTPKKSTDFFSRWRDYMSEKVQSLSVNDQPSTLSNVLHELAFYMLKDWKVKNALVSGLKITIEFNIQRLSQKFEKTVFDDIKNSEAWNILFSCIGEESFCRLLLDNIVLKRIPNLAFCQLSGELISTSLPLEKSKKPKKKKKNMVDLSQTVFLSHASDLQNNSEPKKRPFDSTESNGSKIPRRIRQKMRKEQNKISQNVNNKQHDATDKSNQVDSKQKAEKKRKGPNATDKSNQVDRSRMFLAESPINSKTNKPLMALPKQHMFHRTHAKGIQYSTRCVSTIFNDEFQNERKGNAFLERFSQIPVMIDDIHKRHNRTCSIEILNRCCLKRDSTVDVIDTASSYHEVAQFVMQQLYKVFPSEFWGCKENFEAIRKVLYHFISRQKTEAITLLEIMHKFKVKQCEWLAPPSKPSVLVPSDLKKRQNILGKMLNWLFCGYIVPVIKSMFYVTESTNNTKKMLYFRHDLWHERLHNTLSTTLSNSFARLNGYELLNLKIGCAKIRFLPKGNGFRLITNLGTTTKYERKGRDIWEISVSPKEILQPVLDVMKYHQRQSPDLMGSSVTGKALFYKRLKEYKQKQLDGSKLYFVKADIANCFDTIDQEKLLILMLSILKYVYLLQETEYLSRRISVVRPFCDKLIKKDFKFSGSHDDMENICDQSDQINNIHRGSIVVDQVRTNDYGIDKLETIIELLEESITSNVIIVDDRFYKRKRGIPQGSTLSTMLCSFFLARFEKEKLSFLKNDPTGVFFTYVDDFLFITKNIGYARWFRNALIHEIKRYGLQVNIDKCETNLDKEIEEFSWIGYLLNTKTLDVYLDLPKPADIQSSVTTSFSGHPVEQLYADCVRSIKLQFSPILMDGQFNCKETLTRNLYKNFFSAALKMEAQTTSLGKGIISFNNQDSLFDIVLRLGQFVVPLAPYGISSNEISYLLFQAFFNAYVRRQSRYPKFTYLLKYMLDQYEKYQKDHKRRREREIEESKTLKKSRTQ